MAKIAVVGDRTTTFGFRPLGVDVFEIEEPADVSSVWPDIIAGDYAIVFMTETAFIAAKESVRELETATTPAIAAIPSAAGSRGAAAAYLLELSEAAIGAVIERRG